MKVKNSEKIRTKIKGCKLMKIDAATNFTIANIVEVDNFCPLRSTANRK